jgi:preprotein translocase subunit SecG
MVTLLMVLFIIMCVFLAIFILIQQGKGDMGLTGSLSGSSQMLFGGSGGQTFFEKATWAMGILFMLGSIGLSILKSRQINESQLLDLAAQAPAATSVKKQIPVAPAPIAETEEESSPEAEG